MRILLYTGKGGVGKTSVSAATALRCAGLGYRTVVVSTDAAHSLADSFDLPLGPEPTAIAANLWGQELDVLHEMDRNWGRLQEYAASVFAWRGLDDVLAEEMALLPGVEELSSLIQVVHLYDTGDYDVIIMDCAPTGAALQLLTLPEVGRWYLDRIFPLEKRAVAIGAPLLRTLTDMPIPDEQIFDAAESLFHRLERIQELLSDPEVASSRLVLNPAKMVIAEAQRAYTYLSLYGYPTDAAICNRLLPPEASEGYFSHWRQVQLGYRQTIADAFAPLPVLDVPYFDQEVVGIDMLERMGRALFDERDPTEVMYTGDRPRVIKTEGGYVYHLPLPFVSSADLDLTRSSANELVVRIGNHKRLISLPHTLAALEVARAQHRDGVLTVTFVNTKKPLPGH
jgi:arsenite-transporting ATPase